MFEPETAIRKNLVGPPLLLRRQRCGRSALASLFALIVSALPISISQAAETQLERARVIIADTLFEVDRAAHGAPISKNKIESPQGKLQPLSPGETTFANLGLARAYANLLIAADQLEDHETLRFYGLRYLSAQVFLPQDPSSLLRSTLGKSSSRLDATALALSAHALVSTPDAGSDLMNLSPEQADLLQRLSACMRAAELALSGFVEDAIAKKNDCYDQDRIDEDSRTYDARYESETAILTAAGQYAAAYEHAMASPSLPARSRVSYGAKLIAKNPTTKLCRNLETLRQPEAEAKATAFGSLFFFEAAVACKDWQLADEYGRYLAQFPLSSFLVRQVSVALARFGLETGRKQWISNSLSLAERAQISGETLLSELLAEIDARTSTPSAASPDTLLREYFTTEALLEARQSTLYSSHLRHVREQQDLRGAIVLDQPGISNQALEKLIELSIIDDLFDRIKLLNKLVLIE